MLTPLPPSPASSPPPESSNGHAPAQKDLGINLGGSSNFHNIPPSGLQNAEPEGRKGLPFQCCRDFTPYGEDAEDKSPGSGRRSSCHDDTTRKGDAADPQARNGDGFRGHARRKTGAFPRISRPVELMRDAYDYVVIGSGYGGAVTASRLARSIGRDGRSTVCVMERGRERWPGEYPTKTVDGLKNLHVSGEFSPGTATSVPLDAGDPMGMYHLVLGKGMSAVVGNGLGGTSLINANVFLRADEDTLRMPPWPEEIRSNPAALEPYYKKAEEVLEPATYPDDWPELPKVKLLERQALALGMGANFRLVPQTTRFRVGPNSCGVEMRPSELTGQDATGLNDGSKTTILVTYLADAWNWGAEIFCECEVRYVEECKGPEGGYIVYFAWHGRGRGRFKDHFHEDLMWVRAKKCLFLGAGSIGTTEILLRSREKGLEVSDRVGKGMGGNGDMLAFGYNTDYETNAIGKAFPNPYSPTGPTINSMIDNRRGHDSPLDGYVIQEGAIPGALAPFLQAMLEAMPGSVRPKGESVLEKVRSGMARLGSAVLGPYLQRGAMDSTQVYLVMSHDDSQVVLTLKDDKPALEFRGVDRSDHVERISKVLAEATRLVGGTFVQNPFYAWMGKQHITVHPIGDNTGTTGVANHAGEVFRGEGSETHEGLVVMDGALVPSALGVNPFATITALAERNIDLYARKHNLLVQDKNNASLDFLRPPAHSVIVDLHPEQNDVAEVASIEEVSAVISSAEATRAPGLGFTEVMSGYIHHNHEGAPVPNRSETYERAYRSAKALYRSAHVFLSVQAFDTGTLVYGPEHAALLTGTFVCPALQGSPFVVRRGRFNLSVVDADVAGTRNLVYDFDMRGTDGALLHFHGYKAIDSSVALSVQGFWKATTTLYVCITRLPGGRSRRPGRDPDGWKRGPLVASGILRLEPKTIRPQLRSLTPTGARFLKRMWSVGIFAHYISRASLRPFLGPFAPLQYPSATYDGFVNDTAPDASYILVADDGVRTRLHVWEPTNAGVLARNILLAPGASVDHQIFALPTIRHNLVNHLTHAGYRVFVSVHRICNLMTARGDHTTFDARLDLRAALEHIRTGFPAGNSGPGNKVYVMAHCMGSVALAAGLLDGSVPAGWVSGVCASQVFMNPVWSAVNMAKASAGPVPLDVLYRLLAGKWFGLSTGRGDTLVQRAINEVLRFYPGPRREICSSASCHRCSLVFGRCWNHHSLNEATHRQIDRFFGGVNTTLLRLLMYQGRAGRVMDNSFRPLDTPENIRRLKGLPIFLFVGSDNAVLSPAATERTFSILCDTFGSDGLGGEEDERGEDKAGGVGVLYRRRVVPGYGHLDSFMGRDAWRDVYPMIRAEADRVVREGAEVSREGSQLGC